MKTIITADGTEVPATDYRVYRDELSGVLRQDYDANTPREFVSIEDQKTELSREIERLRRDQQQYDLLGNPAGRAALEPQVQDLLQQLQALNGGA